MPHCRAFERIFIPPDPQIEFALASAQAPQGKLRQEKRRRVAFGAYGSECENVPSAIRSMAAIRFN
jgi:hypothetical protein